MAEALGLVKHALTRRHGLACPFHANPRSMPTPFLLSRLLLTGTARTFAAPAHRAAPSVSSVLGELKAARPFSTSAINSARHSDDHDRGGFECPISQLKRRWQTRIAQRDWGRGGWAARREKNAERVPWEWGWRMNRFGFDRQSYFEPSSFSSSSSSNSSKSNPSKPADFSSSDSLNEFGGCAPEHFVKTSSSRTWWLSGPINEWGPGRYSRLQRSSMHHHGYRGHHHRGQHHHRHQDVVRRPDRRGECGAKLTASEAGRVGDSGGSTSHSSSHSSSSNPDSHSDFASSNSSASSSGPPPPAEGSGPGWGWYLCANERRRRDPGKRRHFKSVMNGFRDDREAIMRMHGLNGRDPCEMAKAWWKMHKRGCGRRNREVWHDMQRHITRRRAGFVLRFREAARGCGGGGGATSGRRPLRSKCRTFNAEVLREIWYQRLYGRWEASRAHHGHRRPFRFSRPEKWIHGAHFRRRGKTGLVYMLHKYSPESRKMRQYYVDGAKGGVHVALGKPPVKDASIGAGHVNPCHLYRNELTAQLATASARRLVAFNFLASTARPASSVVPASARAFSTTPPSRSAIACGTICPMELAVPLLLPLAAVLKSSAALNCLTLLTRLSLTLLPLSFRGRVVHALRTKYASDPSSLSSSLFGRLIVQRGCVAALEQPSGFFGRWNAVVGFPLLALAPVVLLALVALASLERTPVTGRWRIVMLSPAEEAELVDGILAPAPAFSAGSGAVDPALLEGTSRDWVQILRRVLSLPDEGVSPTTGRRILLGGEVLDPRDWRVRWAEAVLRALEKGGEAALVGSSSSASSLSSSSPSGVLPPPPTSYPYEPRAEPSLAQAGWTDEFMFSKLFASPDRPPCACMNASSALAAEAHYKTMEEHAAHAEKDKIPPLRVEYDLLVVDRPDANAFSFGFGPDRAAGAVGEGEKGRRGVIVVYTGFINEILGSSSAPSFASTASPPSPPSSSGLFSSLSTPCPRPSPPVPAADLDPIVAYAVPSTLPSQAQTKSLAVLLSHELAHLCLDHTLEAYASTGLVVPHLMRLGSDVLRTFLYPVTALLGPFLNDALGRTLHEGAQGGFGVLGQAVNSCESRKLEAEADKVALRLLAGSGIDPHYALEFWADRLALSTHSPDASSSSASPAFSSSRLPPQPPQGIRQHSHSHTHGAVDGLLRSHPVDEERVEAIKDELEEWERWWAKQGRSAPAPALA
ncbi:hypothetical protein JCM8097_004133 [Rhodosporidiobolus ruineniae]